MGNQIHPYARVCSIADAFDALTTRRSYKEPIRAFDALNVMKNDMSDQFDPEIFSAFVLQMKRSNVPIPIA